VSEPESTVGAPEARSCSSLSRDCEHSEPVSDKQSQQTLENVAIAFGESVKELQRMMGSINRNVENRNSKISNLTADLGDLRSKVSMSNSEGTARKHIGAAVSNMPGGCDL